MPRPYPAYHPELSPETVATLEVVVRHPKQEHRVVQRAKLALLLHAEPTLGNAAAARRLDQHPNWVRKWRKRWAREGAPALQLQDRPRTGRPPAFSPSGPSDRQSGRL